MYTFPARLSGTCAQAPQAVTGMNAETTHNPLNETYQCIHFLPGNDLHSLCRYSCDDNVYPLRYSGKQNQGHHPVPAGRSRPVELLLLHQLEGTDYLETPERCALITNLKPFSAEPFSPVIAGFSISAKEVCKPGEI
jgi:hypothetical protein